MLNFENAPRSPYGDRLPDERLLRETQDVRAVTVARGVDVGYTLLNRHRIGEAAAIVAIGGFLSDLTMPDRAYEGVQLAALDRPVLMLDLPAHGLSSPHNRQQAVDLCIHRTADSQAAPIVAAVEKLLNPDDEKDSFGISHGLLMSLIMAKQASGKGIKTVFGLDLPSVRKRLSLDLTRQMIRDNTRGRKNYLNVLRDTPHEKDFINFKTVFMKTAPPRAKHPALNNKGLFILNGLASVNARPGGLETWKNVLDTKETRVRVVTAENSSVSDARAIQDFIDGLPPDQRSRSHQTVIAGEDHNIGIVHLMPRAVAWAREAYDSPV